MRMTSCVLGLLAALAATEASAQLANLNGKYVCVQNCRSGAPGGPEHGAHGCAGSDCRCEAGLAANRCRIGEAAECRRFVDICAHRSEVPA